MKGAALKFPELVARTPLRTHAILTKYTALRSFHATNLQVTLPYFERAGVYTNILLEAYLDYKTIAKNIQVLAFEASSGLQALQPSPATAALETSEAALAGAEKSTEKTVDHDEDSVVSVGEISIDDTVSQAVAPLRIRKPYPATIQGLETARTHCRYMLNRIVSEVDVVSRNPDVAIDEKRALPYMSPFLFKELIPVSRNASSSCSCFFSYRKTQVADTIMQIGVPIATSETAGAPAAEKSAADRLGGVLRF